MTNDNTDDAGADRIIGARVAEALGAEGTFIEMPPLRLSGNIPISQLLFTLDAGRDVLRAQRWTHVADAAYENFDLLLGGYGGEVIRGKYSEFGSWEGFAREYYGKKNALPVSLAEPFLEHAVPMLKSLYTVPGIQAPTELNRWLYAVDRMRIWGGVRVRSRSLWGDSLHPFMDWDLLGPLIYWPYEELRDAKFQTSIIEAFAPALNGIPINPSARELGLSVDIAKPTFMQRLIKRGRRTTGAKHVFQRLRTPLAPAKRRELEQIQSIARGSGSLRAVEEAAGLSLTDLERMRNPVTFTSRFTTVVLAVSELVAGPDSSA